MSLSRISLPPLCGKERNPFFVHLDAYNLFYVTYNTRKLGGWRELNFRDESDVQTIRRCNEGNRGVEEESC